MGFNILFYARNVSFLYPRPGVFTAEPWESEYYDAERLQHDKKGKLTKSVSENSKAPVVAPEGGEGERSICFPDSKKADCLVFTLEREAKICQFTWH